MLGKSQDRRTSKRLTHRMHHTASHKAQAAQQGRLLPNPKRQRHHRQLTYEVHHAAPCKVQVGAVGSLCQTSTYDGCGCHHCRQGQRWGLKGLLVAMQASGVYAGEWWSRAWGCTQRPHACFWHQFNIKAVRCYPSVLPFCSLCGRCKDTEACQGTDAV